MSGLLMGGNAIGLVPIIPETESDWTISVGKSDRDESANLFAYGDGWVGGVSSVPLQSGYATVDSSIPFGPWVAACIAVGEVFKAARFRESEYRPLDSAFFDLWSHRACIGPISHGPIEIDADITSAIIGVGAVGSAVVHLLSACKGLKGNVTLVDGDPAGFTVSNLYRYVLFGRSSVGRRKASEAARLVDGGHITWNAVDECFEVVGNSLPQRVLSAVDRNTARVAIQARYPARILSGSSLDLRAEVLRCGPPGTGACLRCYNPPEPVKPDIEVRTELQGLSTSDLSELSVAIGIAPAEVQKWVHFGGCGTAGERVLQYLRREEGPPLFSVGFVSVMAGTMLAAELIKDVLGATGALNNVAQRATFQFFRPLAKSNSARTYTRQQDCPMCNPDTVATKIWRDRYYRLGPNRP